MRSRTMRLTVRHMAEHCGEPLIIAIAAILRIDEVD